MYDFLEEILSNVEGINGEFTVERDGSSGIKVSFSNLEGVSNLSSWLISEIYGYYKKPITVDYVNGSSFISISFGEEKKMSISLSLYGVLNTIQIKKLREGFSDIEKEFIKGLLRKLISKIGRSDNSPIDKLRKLGIDVFWYDDNSVDFIAGYEKIKRLVYETIIYPILYKEVYDEIPRYTRIRYDSILPRGVLFEGPPGVGKTAFAKYIARETKIPMVYVPIESIMSKWYGESAKNLAQVFDLALELNTAIMFLDEIDAFATSRDNSLHEATRRLLSVLLRRLDGVEGKQKGIILIGATNRKEDIDRALLSRFSITIYFPLPDENDREEIIKTYAKHLSSEEIKTFSKLTEGFSVRDIKEICEMTERSWGYYIIQKDLKEVLPPPFDFYKNAVNFRKKTYDAKAYEKSYEKYR
jgi:Cdc6-like AAA superfamily ATPase